MNGLGIIIAKELREIVANKLLLLTVVLPPLLFTIIPITMIWGARVDPMSPAEFGVLYQLYPQLAMLDPVTATQVIMLSQFLIMFMMIPAMIPMVIASYSIIGEKQARSLEPLLATPIAVRALLLGKTVAAVAPAVLATWLAYLLMLAGVAIFGTPLAMKAVTTSTWLLAVALLGPLLSLAAVGLAVMISSRVNDTRVAQQAAGLLVLPLVGIFVAQLAGWVLIDTRAILSSAVVLLAADIAILLVAERLFQRERILTQWR